MKDIAGDLAEHHHKGHLGNLKIGNKVQVRGNRAEQINPPVAWRREEQGRQKMAVGSQMERCPRAETPVEFRQCPQRSSPPRLRARRMR